MAGKLADGVSGKGNTKKAPAAPRKAKAARKTKDTEKKTETIDD